ncbi:exonuclease domain-containing protein [Aeromicrobium sp. Leaf350]|uniref:exonuclease domain-containing protein n=1 Tax=Aeromicrobium sp. Leaf350 TaxID=2876565 RepID=UPI001E3E483F|nr:exonuclease domain-containing protein [Aeromicrobium sp. Leaf350]
MEQSGFGDRAGSAGASATPRRWHDGPLAALDFETTGVDPLHDRVISFALLTDDESHDGLVDPGVPVPAAASSVHGLDASSLVGAPSSVIALAVVARWVDRLVDRGVPLVVFNAAYDLTMLAAECRRHGIAEPDWWRLVVVDPYLIDCGLTPRRRGQRRLVDVAQRLGVPLVGAHEANADARAALEVARVQAARNPQLGELTSRQLMSQQQRWHAAKAESWNRWAIDHGRSLDDPAGWPLAAAVRQQASA